jgi:hypothetical protein
MLSSLTLVLLSLLLELRAKECHYRSFIIELQHSSTARLRGKQALSGRYLYLRRWYLMRLHVDFTGLFSVQTVGRGFKKLLSLRYIVSLKLCWSDGSFALVRSRADKIWDSEQSRPRCQLLNFIKMGCLGWASVASRNPVLTQTCQSSFGLSPSGTV